MARDTILHVQAPVGHLNELVITIHDPKIQPHTTNVIAQDFSHVMEVTLGALRLHKPMLVLVETTGCGRDLIEELRRHGFRVIAVEPSHFNRS